MRLTTQSLFVVSLLGAVSVPLAGSEAIGFAVATGNFKVDSAQVYGNTTLFDGATVSTANASSRLALTNGARMTLGEDSQARIFEKRMTLERGTGELKTAVSYQIDALTLQVSPLDAKSIARVKLEGPRHVLVSAVNGRVRVLNEAGQLVANVEPGATLLFTPQASEAGTFKMSGCLVASANGKFFLIDPNQTVELRGSGLAVGTANHVDITGVALRSAFPTPPASQVVQVDTGGLKQAAVGGCEKSIGKLESSGVKTAKPRRPIEAAAIEHPQSPVSIYAGVGVAAGVGGALAPGSGQMSAGPVTTEGNPSVASSSRGPSNPRIVANPLDDSSPRTARGTGRPYPSTSGSPLPGSSPLTGSSHLADGRPYPAGGTIRRTDSSPPRVGGPPAGGAPPTMPSMSP